LAGVRPSLADPPRYQDVNLGGTLQVLEAMRRHGVKRLIFASSSSVYGNDSQAPFREDSPAERPISPYAATKKAGELLTHVYHHLYGFSVHCLRFFTAYGPRQRPDLAIRKFAGLIIDGRPITIYGDGSSARDFTYIDDIVAGVSASLDRLTGYHIYNHGYGRTVSVLDLVKLMGRILGVEPNLAHDLQQPGDVDMTHADITLAARELGYMPVVSLAEGLERFMAWLRSTANRRP
jgi:UDP-glucuronate 4-epimerase